MSDLNIFITGASGCVGHYLLDILTQNPKYHLTLLSRNPARFRFPVQNHPRITVIHEDMGAIDRQEAAVQAADYVIHLATDWGGAPHINLGASQKLFDMIDPGRCQKIIAFSTASVLNEQSDLSDIAGRHGPGYVRTKYEFQKILRAHPLYERTITLYPTLVIGGDATHPISHIVEGLPKILKRLWLIRFLRAEASCHFIHAEDIAKITVHLLASGVRSGEIVLGNPAVTLNDAIEALCRARGVRAPFTLTISPQFLKSLAHFFRVQMDPWTDYHLERKHFTFRVSDAAALGLPSRYRTLDEMIGYFQEIGVL